MRTTASRWRRSVAGTALSAIILAQLFVTADAADTNCLDTEAALDYWRPTRENAENSQDSADERALELISCLASPNPELRDQIGYELFAFWLRGEKLTDNTRRSLLGALSTNLTTNHDDEADNAALARSFSALILAELMRSDSITPFMTGTERQKLLNDVTDSLKRENDYRGLDSELGWVHPVAHMGDLLWRFALHEHTDAAQANAIIGAVRSKVAPTEVFYGFNESDRLARVITTIVTRELVSNDTLSNWISSFANPQSMEKWSDAFTSRQGMAELHNTKLFLRALADQLDSAEINPAIAEKLDELISEFTQLI